MKIRFSIIAILLAFLTIPLMSAPKPKYKSLWLSGCANYEGYVVKKIPEGEGKLTVYYPKDVKRKDVITGTFANGKVTNANLCLNDDKVVYSGTISYKVTPESASYTIYEGKLNDFPFKDSLVIQRKYSDFKTNHLTLNRNLKQISRSGVEEELFQHLSCFIEEEHKPTMGVVQTLELSTDGYLTKKFTKDNKWSLGDDRYLKRTIHKYGDWRHIGYELLNSKTDSLNIRIYNKSFLEFVRGENTIKRVFADGSIFYSDRDGHKIYWDDFCSETDKDRIENLPSDRHLPVGAVVDKDCCPKTVTIRFADGSIFRGWIKSKEQDAIMMILHLSELPDKSEFGYGVIDYPDGSYVVYMNGMSLDEAIEYDAAIRAKEKEAAMKAEAEQRLKEQRERQQERQPLYNKYGKKYVDTLYDSKGRTILVGTPFELIQQCKYYYVELEIDYGDSKCYDWYEGNLKRGYIWVRNGKVTSVSYYHY